MPCCSHDGAPSATAIGAPSTRSPPTTWRRLGSLIQWALPISALAMIPKCPLCVAGYVLLFTGMGVSLSTAAALRRSLIALSIATLIGLLLRSARRAVSTPRPPLVSENH